MDIPCLDIWEPAWIGPSCRACPDSNWRRISNSAITGIIMEDWGEKLIVVFLAIAEALASFPFPKSACVYDCGLLVNHDRLGNNTF